MGNNATSSITKRIGALFRTGTAIGLTDDTLLDRFRSGPDDEAEAAFAVLVERHGPMVLQVCRRILGDCHDAEDAAQATFLVFARKARSIRRMNSLASWLYGVAVRVASRLRLDAARRRRRERRGAERSLEIRRADSEDEVNSDTWQELYQELGRLPERFRQPIVLCDLEGLTHERAAQRLGCPVRTIQSRLSRGRERLRAGLTRRGVVPAVAVLTAALARDTAKAAVSENWKHATATAAVGFAAGSTAAGLVPSTVTVLAQGALRAMKFNHVVKSAAALLLIGVAAGGAGMGMWGQSQPPQPDLPPTPKAGQNDYRVTLAGGATVEVVAVSSFPSGPQTWWKPDGTPLAEPPADPAPYPHQTPADQERRTVLIRVSNLPKDAYLRWSPTYDSGCLGISPTKNGQKVSGLEAYITSVRKDRKTCDVKLRLAAGPWKTEITNDGRGGVGKFVNGHKFAFGQARPFASRGRSMTVFAVAHNFFGQDRRIVAIDRDSNAHPAVSYSAGSDGDKKWVIDIVDAELPLPPEQIAEYQVQFRPFELADIKEISLNPRTTEK